MSGCCRTDYSKKYPCISEKNPCWCLCVLCLLPFAIVYTILQAFYDRICCASTKGSFGQGTDKKDGQGAGQGAHRNSNSELQFV